MKYQQFLQRFDLIDQPLFFVNYHVDETYQPSSGSPLGCPV